MSKELFDHLRQFPCPLCGTYPTDVCHIKSKKSGGSDKVHNLISMCRKHHSEQHKLGWHRFCQKYPIMKSQLANKGWEFFDEFGIKRLRRVDKE